MRERLTPRERQRRCTDFGLATDCNCWAMAARKCRHWDDQESKSRKRWLNTHFVVLRFAGLLYQWNRWSWWFCCARRIQRFVRSGQNMVRYRGRLCEERKDLDGRRTSFIFQVNKPKQKQQREKVRKLYIYPSLSLIHNPPSALRPHSFPLLVQPYHIPSFSTSWSRWDIRQALSIPRRCLTVQIAELKSNGMADAKTGERLRRYGGARLLWYFCTTPFV